MSKTWIGAIIIFIMGFFLKDAFYEALCEQGKFACFLGWIAFKSPTLIIIVVITIAIYLWRKERK